MRLLPSYLAIVLALSFAPQVFSTEQPTAQKNEPTLQVSAEDLQVIALMELLEKMEMLENLELMAAGEVIE